MEFAFTDRCNEYRATLLAFMDECIYPNEHVYHQQLLESGDPHHHPAVMEELKAEARKRGLWNLFLPDERYGAGLSNLDYAPLAEIMGQADEQPLAVREEGFLMAHRWGLIRTSYVRSVQ